MRIRTVHINGFGIHHDMKLDLPDGPAPVVWYGPNEAGKSTLAAFVRAVLYGFAPRSQPSERREPLRGGRHGGYLLVEDDDGRLIRIERTDGGDGARPGSSAGTVKVTTADGTAGGQELLASLLGGIGPELHRHLFAFGLDELEDVRSLQADELGPYLFSAGMGIDGSRVLRSEQKIRQELEQLYRQKGVRQDVPKLLAAIEETDRALREAREESARFDRQQAEWRTANEKIGELEERLGACRKRADWLAACRGARPHWLQAIELREEFDRLPAVASFPEDGLSRFESAAAERDRLETLIEAKRRDRARLEEQIALLAVDEALLDRRKEIESLRGRVPAYRETRIRLAELGQELATVAQELQRVLALIDPDWDEDKLRAFPLDVGTRENVRAQRDRVRDIRHRLLASAGGHERVAKQREAAAAERDRLENEAQTARRAASELCPGLAGCSSQEAREVRDELQRECAAWERLAERLGASGERVLEVRGRLDDWRQWGRASGPAAKPGPALALALGGGTAGVAAALAVARLTPYGLPGGLAVLAVLGGLVFLGARRLWRGGSSAPGPAARRMGERLETEAKEREAEHRRLEQSCRDQEERVREAVLAIWASPQTAAGAQAAGVPSAVRSGSLAEAQGDKRELPELAGDAFRAIDRYAGLMEAAARLEERAEAFRGQLRAIGEQTAEQQRERERTEAELREWEADWRAWLARAGLSAGLSPEGAEDIFRLAEQAVRLQQQRDRLDAQRKGGEERLADAHRAYVGLFGDEPDDFETDIAARANALDAALAADRQRREWTEAIAALEEGEAELRIPLERTNAAIGKLYREAGCEEEEEYRRRAAQYARRQAIAGELGRIDAVLGVWAGERGIEALSRQLADATPDQLDRLIADERERMQRIEQELNEWKDKRGRCARDLEQLRAGTQLTELRLRREQQRAGLLERVERWSALALVGHLLKATRHLYETERQPAVLRRASDHFRLMTEGKFARIVAKLGEQTVYAARPDGELLEASRLSRGTAEQMFIAIRFALADEYARNVSLPIVADDIFVNFDDKRLASAMNVLREVCSRHQFVMCTCHPHIVQAIREAFPDAHVRELAYS